MSGAKRLKSLEDENAKLRKLLADTMLDNSALKDVLEKIVVPGAQRKAIAYASVENAMSHGAHMLTDERLNVAEVAAESGFSD